MKARNVDIFAHGRVHYVLHILRRYPASTAARVGTISDHQPYF